MYRINVRTIRGDVLCFKGVEDYNVEDGFVTFLDSKTSLYKKFAVPNCEIEEENKIVN